jgi:hypothetical protein
MEVNESNEEKGRKRPSLLQRWLVNDLREVWLARVTLA